MESASLAGRRTVTVRWPLLFFSAAAKAGRQRILLALSATLLILPAGIALGQGFSQVNVNTAGPTPAGWLDSGNPLKQMNEPDCAVAPGNPLVVVCGMNDYSGVDPGSLDVPNEPFAARSIGDSSAGIAMSTDGGRRWIRGLVPCHFADTVCSIGERFMADSNLSAVPGALFHSIIAGSRDGTTPGGLYMFTWFENHAETGPPYNFSHVDLLKSGTGGEGPGGTFLDKPGQTESLAAPGTPPVEFQIPDPNNPGAPQTIEIPAGSIHFAHSEFVGNDNNPFTKIIYNRYDNYDFTNAAFTTKVTEGTEVNQGAAIATRDNGSDNLIVWRRFRHKNEKATIMFVTCNLNKCTKPAELVQVCPHDQTTGRARPRMLALPAATSDGDNWYVFYSDRGDGNQNCFDDDGVPIINANGVEARLDYSRIMMATWDGQGKATWQIQPLDDQREVAGDNTSLKIKGQQVMPATTAAGGVVQVIWDDTRDSRLYSLIEGTPAALNFEDPNTGIDRFIEDFVFTQQLGLQPARVYEADNDPPLPEGTPFRHSIDVWGQQIINGTPASSFKVSRYPVGRSPFTGSTVQLQHSFSGGRLFRLGSRPFYADYKSVAAPAFRLNQFMEWESAAGAPAAGSVFNFPIFYAGFTDNRLVRGNVYYNGCDESDPAKNCANVYEIPNQNVPAMALAPLEGEEDPSVTPQVCTPGEPKALSRNQKVFVAAIRPGLALTVVSARKPENPMQDRTFVLYVQNSTPAVKTVTLSVEESAPARWNRAAANPTLKMIEVIIPPKTGAVRTLFVDGLPDGIIVTATDTVSGEQAQALINGNIDSELENFNGVLTNEDYTLSFLGPRVVSSQDLENQDLENQDLENSVLLQDLENESLLQDLENVSILQDLENQDLENLMYEAQDLENVGELQDLENRALLFQDLENQDLENQDLENDGFDAQDLENLTILYQDLENQDLENAGLNDQPYTEVSWPLKPESNTTIGINAKIIAAAGSTEGLTTQVFITQSYLTHTVSQNPNGVATGQFCTPQVVAESQVIYNEVNPQLDASTVNPGLAENVVSFFTQPGVATTVSVRIYGDANFPVSNLGLAAYAQAAEEVDCAPELIPGSPEIPGCEIDFEPDTTAPVLGGVPGDPPAGSPFSLAPDETTFTWEWGPISASDEDPTVTVACPPGDPVPGSPDFTFTYPFPLGDTTVMCSATDSSGNSVAESFTVTIIDTTAPVVTLPPDILDAEATGALTNINIGTATATDAFPPVTITSDAPAAGFPIGTTMVTWFATDANGNSSNATQSVTIVDTTPPAISAPADIVSFEATGALTPVGIGIATATDISDPITITNDAPAAFPLGTTVVIWTATDAFGNPATALQNVTVIDLTAPMFTSVPPDITSFEASGTLTPIDIGTATASDLVDAPVITNDAPASFPLGTTVVTWMATDASGNVSTAVQSVTVVDTSGPTLSVPADITDAEASGVLTDVDIGSATADDTFPPLTIDNDAPAAGFPLGTTLVTWTATDANGNSSSATQNVTIVDTTPPELSVQDFTVVTAGTSITVDYADFLQYISATDLVDGVNVTIDCTPTLLFLEENLVTCTATDTRMLESAPQSLTVTVEYAFDVEIDRIKVNIQAGSTVPIDFRYRDRESGQAVDSSGFDPSISWAGPFTGARCSGVDTGQGSGQDSGFSDFRFGFPTWQFSWQTPSMAGSYLVTIDPPGTAASSFCVTLK